MRLIITEFDPRSDDEVVTRRVWIDEAVNSEPPFGDDDDVE